MRTKSSWVVLLVGAVFLLESILIGVAEARGGGGRGGGGGGGRGGGGRGGGSFSRSSPASGGSFSSRPAARPSTRPGPSSRPVQPSSRPAVSQRPGNSQIGSGDRQENRQERREERRDERRDRLDQAHDDGHDDHDDDYWDDHYYYSGYGYSDVVVVGTTTETVYVETLPCDYATVVVNNGIQYYRCDSTWYRRGYEGGTVVYIVDSPPPGN